MPLSTIEEENFLNLKINFSFYWWVKPLIVDSKHKKARYKTVLLVGSTIIYAFERECSPVFSVQQLLQLMLLEREQ